MVTKMSKKDFLKRLGNLYALAIQKGYTEEEMQAWAEKHFQEFKKAKENK